MILELFATASGEATCAHKPDQLISMKAYL